jgi:hypothetical protein
VGACISMGSRTSTRKSTQAVIERSPISKFTSQS